MSDWLLVKSIFEQALDSPRDARDALLARLCDGRAEVRAQVEALLRAHGEAGEFLRSPTVAPTAWAEAPVQPEALVGTTIGPYRIVALLGEGGFGAVYRAEQDEPVRRSVAVKVLKPGMDTREVIRRFDLERQTLAMMTHPHIARALDAGATPAGRPYFVMEFAEGQPITEYCDAQRLGLRRRLELMIDVCRAVQHAHQKGIIHRDLKPGNVLVTEVDGLAIPKVIDFGIAKALNPGGDDHTRMTGAAQLLGTPAYMSPEQARQTHADVDTRADVYSLGVLLYELATGMLPFEAGLFRGAAMADVQRLIVEQEPPRPSARLSRLGRSTQRQAAPSDTTLERIAANRSLPAAALRGGVRGDLDWIIMRCLEKDRERRYASAAELARDLERHLSDEPVSAGPPSTAYRLRKFARRHRGALVAASAVLAALVGGLALAISGFLDANAARQLAEDQRGRAASAAARAAAVNRFLLDMLASADPRQRGEDVTVRQILHEAAVGLAAGSLDAEPDVKSAVVETIGSALRELALYEEADPQLRAGLALARQVYGEHSAEAADALAELAELQVLREQFDEAERLLREAIAINEAVRGPTDARLAANYTDLGVTLHGLERIAEAEEAHRAALAIARATPTAGDALAEALNNLALLLASQGQFAEAEPLYREALDVNLARLGARNPARATTLDNLAQVLAATGRPDEAERLYREALETRLALFGTRHRDVAYTQHNLAHLLFSRDPHSAEIEQLLRASLETLNVIYGWNSDDALTVHASLVSVMGARGRLADAETLLLEAYDALPADAPGAAPRRRALARRLAELYTALEQPERAAEWKTKAAAPAATAQP